MSANMSKKFIIIADPNGAGRTTSARSFLPADARCPRFINADLIAAGMERIEAKGYNLDISRYISTAERG